MNFATLDLTETPTENFISTMISQNFRFVNNLTTQNNNIQLQTQLTKNLNYGNWEIIKTQELVAKKQESKQQWNDCSGSSELKNIKRTVNSC